MLYFTLYGGEVVGDGRKLLVYDCKNHKKGCYIKDEDTSECQKKTVLKSFDSPEDALDAFDNVCDTMSIDGVVLDDAEVCDFERKLEASLIADCESKQQERKKSKQREMLIGIGIGVAASAFIACVGCVVAYILHR